MKERIRPAAFASVPVTCAIPPQAAAHSVPRARLDALSERLVAVSAALVTAPGGYGKTTLMRSWFEALGPPARTAWLSLAPHMSPSELIEGIALTCSRASDAFGGSVLSLLREPNLDPRACATALVNELFVLTEDSGTDLVLFIDDLQFVADDEDSLTFLSSLLQSLPARVHLVFASRRRLTFAPLAKLRNQGCLFEVDEDELRFRPEEARLIVDDGDAAEQIVERTDGWAIAIHLTAMLAKARGLTAASAFPLAGEAVFPFLAEEVISTLEPDLRQTILELAIPAAIDAATVDFILERSDGAAILNQLLQRSLYLQRADDGSLRFHHLFREFLLSRLRTEQPPRYRALCRRYASWLRERGDSVNALEQLIEAGDPVEIVEYVDAAIVAIRFTDRYRRLLELLAQVPAEVKRSKPVLYRFHAIALQRAGRLEEADAQLKACYDAALHAGDKGVAFHALLERGIGTGAFRFRVHGDYKRSEAYFREALALAESEALCDRPAFKKLAYMVLGLAYALRFEYAQALEWLSEAERLELGGAKHFELLFVETARVYAWMGDYARALEYAELAEELFRTHAPYHVGYALLVEAKAMVALGASYDRCITVCRETIDALRTSFEDEELGAAWAVYAEALLASPTPDIEAIANACVQAERFLDPANTAVRCEVAMIRARAAELAGDAAGWQQAMRSAQRLTSGDRWLSARTQLQRAFYLNGSGEMRTALDLFAVCVEEFEQIADSAHSMLARIGTAACRIRLGIAGAAEPRDVLEALAASPASHVASQCPALVREIVYWCMRSGIEVRSVSTLIELAGISGDPELAAIARDSGIPPGGRCAALRASIAGGTADARSLLFELARDLEPRVAATAADLLAAMPPDTVEPLRIEAIATLRVRSGEHVIVDGESGIGRKKAAELLRLLVLAGAPLAKSTAIAALWPDASKGRDVTLRVTIHALRRALQPDLPNLDDLISYDGVTVALRRRHVASVDAEIALEKIRRGKHLASIGDWDAAAELLLDATAQLGAAPKELDAPAWLQTYLRAWRAETLEGLRTLTGVYRAQGQRDRALDTIRRAIALDPLDEAALVTALDVAIEMRLFDEGHAFYAAYKKGLADAIGAAPGPQVVERYSRLLALRSERERSDLSNRETEILRLVSQGRTSKEIADALDLSTFTVNNHVGRILKKLGVESRAAAVARFHALEGNL